LKLSEQKLSTILKVLLTEQGLDWALRDGVLQITSQESAEKFLKAAVYDVRDLCQNSEESVALQAAIQSQTRAFWVDVDGAGGAIHFAKPGVMVVYQSEQTHDELLQLLENYRIALRGSKPRPKPGSNPQEVIVRYYRLPTVMVRELVETLPTLIVPESWQSAERPDAPGQRRSIASQPGPLSTGQPSSGTPIVVEHSILIVTHTREVHEELGKLLQKLQTGDPLVEPQPGMGGMGGFGGGGFGGGFPMVK
jgi:hypothetical protein